MKIIRNVYCLLFIFAVSVTAIAQKSDRAIVDKFQQSVKSLAQAADAAKTVQDCAEVTAAINDLETEFTPNRELLDKSLYPDDFTKTIMNLKGRMMVRQNDLGLIETQIIRITELETQVRELSSRVDSLSLSNTQLLSETQRLSKIAASDKAMIDSLNSVVAKLRQNLKARDQLIFALVDSLFQQYDKNIESLNDVEKQQVVGKLERRNVLTNVKKSISDNMKFLESTTLTANDFAEIERQHARFETQWKGVGSKIASVYLSGKQKSNEVAGIDSMLTMWSSKVNERTWKALVDLFEKGGVALKPFTTGNEFYRSFSAFLDEQVQNPAGESKDVRSKRFNNFNTTVWTTELDPIWLPVLVETGKITAEQKLDIEKKVEAWRSSIAPTSWIYYVLIALVLIVILRFLSKFIHRKPTTVA